MPTSTKPYQYINNGVLASTDVTVTIWGCPLNDPLPGQTSTTYLDIEATIPAAVSGDILVDIKVNVDYYNYSSSGNQTYNTQIKIPAGSKTSGVVQKACSQKSKDSNGLITSQTTTSYEFLDQQKVPEETSAPTLTYTKTDPSCYQSRNGTISVSVSGGTAPFDFAWSDGGPNDPLRTGLGGGTFAVTVTDVNGLQASLTNIVLTWPTLIKANGTKTDVTCFGGTNGSISIAPTGGAGGYKYKWNDGSTLKNRTGLKAGKYTVNITDANGCGINSNYTILQPEEIKITVLTQGTNAILEVTGGTAPYHYFWSDNVAQKDRYNLADGTYSVTVTDANGCKSTATVTIKFFNFYFSKNPVLLELEALSLHEKPNLSFALDLFLEESYLSENFVLKYSTQHPARIDGTTDFDVREVLNAYLAANVPAFGDTQVRIVRESFKRFYLSHAEIYGNPPVQAPSTQVDTFYVVFAGLSDQEYAKNKFFDQYLATQRAFFTWQPLDKDVVKRQHEYLHFVSIDGSVTELHLVVKLKYDDGTESTQTSIRVVNNVKPNEVYRFPVGYNQLNLDAYANGKGIVSYSVKLSFAGISSQERNYRVISDFSHYKIFLYLNSLGGWDTLLCKGRGKTSLRTREEAIDRELPVGYTYSTRAKEVTSKTGDKTAEVVIGNLTAAEKRHLVDFAISEKVYEQTASGYLPVDVKFDFEVEDNMESLDEEVSFDVIYPTIKKYTPEL